VNRCFKPRICSVVIISTETTRKWRSVLLIEIGGGLSDGGWLVAEECVYTK
jgi:hypothetical protein